MSVDFSDILMMATLFVLRKIRKASKSWVEWHESSGATLKQQSNSPAWRCLNCQDPLNSATSITAQD